MRTLVAVIIGIVLALLLNALRPPRTPQGAARSITGATIFIGLWFVAAVIDLFVGVAAGHGFGEELAIHALIFVVPAGLAWFLARRSGAGGMRN